VGSVKLSKTYKAWVKLAERTEGWSVKKKTKGIQLRAPGGEIIGMHHTESDHRAVKNTRARLKAAGLDV
jgi:hypothetical protein